MRYQRLDNDVIIAKVRELAEKKKVFRDCNLTSKTVADEIGISRSSLSSIVNSELGMTFTEYISRLRLEYAHEMMVDGEENKSLEQISLLSGFSCPSSFYRQHKKIYGTSPKESIKLKHKR